MLHEIQCMQLRPMKACHHFFFRFNSTSKLLPWGPRVLGRVHSARNPSWIAAHGSGSAIHTKDRPRSGLDFQVCAQLTLDRRLAQNWTMRWSLSIIVHSGRYRHSHFICVVFVGEGYEKKFCLEFGIVTLYHHQRSQIDKGDK